MEANPVQDKNIEPQLGPPTSLLTTRRNPKYFKWIIAAIITVVLITIGTGYLLLQKFASKSSTLTQEPTTSQLLAQSKQTKTFTSQKSSNLNEPGYTLKHPGDWSEKYVQLNYMQNYLGSDFTLTKDDYSIIIVQKASEAGGSCIYTASDISPDDEMYGYSDKIIIGKPYVDLITQIGHLRRNEEIRHETLQDTKGHNSFFFCVETEGYPGNYGPGSGVGEIYYLVPDIPDKAMLAEMDNIIKSITKIDETANWKTFFNPKYGFEFKYPPKGKILAKNGQQFIEGECGNGIIEEEPSQDYPYYLLTAENFFSVDVIPWQGNIHEYLVKVKADNLYNFKNISGSNADEAVTVLEKPDAPKVSNDFNSPFIWGTRIYKKADNLFIIGFFQDDAFEKCTRESSTKGVEETFKFTE